VHDTVEFVLRANTRIYKHRLTLVGLEETVLENDVKIVVNCHDVGSHTHQCCKSDITAYYCL